MLRPLGNLQNALKHLDRYKIDEICIIRPVREHDSSFKSDVDILKNAKSSTPLAFGGGIRSLDDIGILKGLPVERFVLSSGLFNPDLCLIEKLHSRYGEQSIVGFIPFTKDKKYRFFHSSSNSLKDLCELNKKALKLCDEIVLHDCKSEGQEEGFDHEVMEVLGIDRNNMIYSGGVSQIVKNLDLVKGEPKSILIENKVLHRENSKMTFYGAV